MSRQIIRIWMKGYVRWDFLWTMTVSLLFRVEISLPQKVNVSLDGYAWVPIRMTTPHRCHHFSVWSTGGNILRVRGARTVYSPRLRVGVVCFVIKPRCINNLIKHLVFALLWLTSAAGLWLLLSSKHPRIKTSVFLQLQSFSHPKARKVSITVCTLELVSWSFKKRQ